MTARDPQKKNKKTKRENQTKGREKLGSTMRRNVSYGGETTRSWTSNLKPRLTAAVRQLVGCDDLNGFSFCFAKGQRTQQDQDRDRDQDQDPAEFSSDGEHGSLKPADWRTFHTWMLFKRLTKDNSCLSNIRKTEEMWLLLLQIKVELKLKWGFCREISGCLLAVWFVLVSDDADPTT